MVETVRYGIGKSEGKEINSPANVLFVHGGSILEGVSRRFVAWLKKQEKPLQKLKVLDGDVYTPQNAIPDMRGFLDFVKQEKLPIETFNAIPLMMRDDFKMADFTHIANENMTKLANEGHLDTVIGHSVGSLATLEALCDRINQQQALPRLVILIDPLLGGLTEVAKKYMTKMGKTKSKQVLPAIEDICADSLYLKSLHTKLIAAKDKMPPVVIIKSRVPADWAASPFAALPQEKFAKLAADLHIPLETGNDGMAKFLDEKQLFAKGKLSTIILNGLTHTDTLRHSRELLKEIIKHETVPNERIIDHTDWLTSKDNQLKSKFMKLALKIVAGKNND